MSSSMERRLRVLEDASDGDDCPRCSGLTATFINGELDHASRYGESISREEYFTLEAQEGPDGRCPVCGELPVEIEGP